MPNIVLLHPPCKKASFVVGQAGAEPRSTICKLLQLFAVPSPMLGAMTGGERNGHSPCRQSPYRQNGKINNYILELFVY